MAKVIQQDTFDTVIQENIVEFGMSGKLICHASVKILQLCRHISS